MSDAAKDAREELAREEQRWEAIDAIRAAMEGRQGGLVPDIPSRSARAWGEADGYWITMHVEPVLDALIALGWTPPAAAGEESGAADDEAAWAMASSGSVWSTSITEEYAKSAFLAGRRSVVGNDNSELIAEAGAMLEDLGWRESLNPNKGVFGPATELLARLIAALSSSVSDSQTDAARSGGVKR